MVARELDNDRLGLARASRCVSGKGLDKELNKVTVDLRIVAVTSAT